MAEKTVKEMINDFFKNIGGDTNELAKELRKLDSKYMYRDGKTRTKLKAQARANMKKNKESNKRSKKNKKVDRSSYTKPEKNTAGLKATTTESPLASLVKKSKATKNKKVDRSSYTKPEKNTAGLKATTTESPLASLTKTSKNKKKVKNVNPDDGFPRPKNIKIPKGSTLSGLAKKYGTTVKNLMSLNPQIKNADKIYAGRNLNVGANTKVKKPISVKKPKTINSPTSEERNAGAGKFTKKTPGYTPKGNKKSMNRGKETKKAAPKKESFLGFEKISGPKGMFIAPAGVRKMKTPFGGTIEVDSTPLKDREDRKVGGKVVKRNVGGPAKPRKKVVFRRGGGKALRGFGKATYSNKMY
jgi:LysM repeat protein